MRPRKTIGDSVGPSRQLVNQLVHSSSRVSSCLIVCLAICLCVRLFYRVRIILSWSFSFCSFCIRRVQLSWVTFGLSLGWSVIWLVCWLVGHSVALWVSWLVGWSSLSTPDFLHGTSFLSSYLLCGLLPQSFVLIFSLQWEMNTILTNLPLASKKQLRTSRTS